MRVVVTGARGLLGAQIVSEFERDCHVTAFDRARLDITDASAVAVAVASAQPDVIVNCAVYNGVDQAEEEPVQAFDANAFAVLGLARAAATAGAVFVHYSSDFVFDGETDRPYSESDTPNPRSVYGASKLLADLFALEYERSCILRVESLFGKPAPGGRRKGSVDGIVERIRAGDEVRVFTDRVVSPSYTPDVARATRALVEGRLPAGLYHCVNSGMGTWEEIAAHAAHVLGKPLRPVPITLATANLRARRPRFCAMSNAKLVAAGVPMRTWQEALEEFLR
ncbi:MAG: dTDP-4-dehydrorhamnose reductase [Acidobacteria bacterium]|nr:dTDP-4-dehydrorhamnose reductase [Acidobacteriota bacterium]